MEAVAEQTILKPAVLPYFLDRESFPEDLPQLIYRKLNQQDILPDLFHERILTQEEFVKLAQDSLFYVFMNLETSEYVGIAWLTDVNIQGMPKKAAGNIAFFAEYQVPEVTEIFGKMVLDHWFNIVGLELVYGLTPKSNLPAQQYARRLGMKYQCSLPGFTSRRGEISDGMIFVLRGADFVREG